MPGHDHPEGAAPRRRDFLRYSGGVAAAGGLAGSGLLAPAAAQATTADASGTSASTASASTDGAAAEGAAAPSAGFAAASGNLAASPIRPPAAPLAVRGPYLSTWLPSTTLPGTWPQFWTGHITAMGGIARIDGVSYMFMGAPTIVLDVPNGNNGNPSTVNGFERALEQTNLEVTPTRSRFTLEGGGVELVVEFFSPVEPGDLPRQSIPLSYLLISARTIDGHAHDVQVYADISGEWTSGDVGQQITWSPSQVSYAGGTLQVWSVQLSNQQPLTEQGQLAAWGSIVWATPASARLTYQSGQDLVVRAQFVNNGKLTNSNDTNYRAIDNNWPVFGFCADLGQVGRSAATVPLSIGLVRTPAVSYLGQNLQPLWTTKFATWQDMLGFFHGDLAAARRRADRLDARITGDAKRPAGRPTPGCAPSRCARPTAAPNSWPARAGSHGRC